QPRRLYDLHAGSQKQQFVRTVDLAVAPEEAAVDVARPQRSVAESAHAADPAGVVVLEKRQRLSSVPVPRVELPGQQQGQAARERVKVLVGVGGLPVLEISRRCSELQRRALQVP